MLSNYYIYILNISHVCIIKYVTLTTNKEWVSLKKYTDVVGYIISKACRSVFLNQVKIKGIYYI